MPEPPDPHETAQAQTGANIATATANAALGNVNQVTPQGSLTYTQSGQQFINDANGQTWWKGPNGELTQTAPAGVQGAGTTTREPVYRETREGGKVQTGWKEVETPGGTTMPEGWSQVSGYYVPTYTATQTISPGEQAVYDAGVKARGNLANLAANQSAFLNDYLGKPMDLSGAPAAGDPSKLSMPSYTQFASSPSFERYASAPALATTFGDAGAINSNYLTSFGDAGRINKDFLTEFDDAGPITRTYNGDFSEDRQRVEDALMARLQPYIDRDQEAQRTQLLNSGIRQGSTAYSGAQGDFDRKVNDARIANILAASEEQSRLVGMERDRAIFENEAQQQDFAQKATRAQFANQGLQFENEAQAQEFGQLLSRAQFTNQGIQLGNAAQEQRFRQLLDRATFGNQATQQNFLNQFNVTQANNNNAQQTWSNNFNATQGNNSLATQSLQNELARIQAQNAARSQYLTEQFAVRNQPINEIGAMLGTGQVSSPNFVNANMPTIPTTDVAGLINENFNQRSANAQAQAAASQNLLGGLFSLGSSFLMSDRRTKKDVKRIGKTDDGQNLYFFRYKHDPEQKPQIGLMAQEVEKKKPGAVAEFGGIKHVNVEKALDGLMAYGAAA